MKRTKKAVIASIAIAAVAFSALTFTACGGKEEGTYTMTLTAEQCAGNLYAAGFMDYQQASMENTLVLDNGNYTLTKNIITPPSKEITDPTTGETTTQTIGIDIEMVFTGTYKVEGEVVVLSKAVDCEFDANYGILAEAGLGFTNCSGKASNGDVFKGYGTWEDNPLDMFPGEFIAHAGGINEEVRVELDSTDSTYKIAKAVSSDDD